MRFFLRHSFGKEVVRVSVYAFTYVMGFSLSLFAQERDMASSILQRINSNTSDRGVESGSISTFDGARDVYSVMRHAVREEKVLNQERSEYLSKKIWDEKARIDVKGFEQKMTKEMTKIIEKQMIEKEVLEATYENREKGNLRDEFKDKFDRQNEGDRDKVAFFVEKMKNSDDGYTKGDSKIAFMKEENMKTVRDNNNKKAASSSNSSNSNRSNDNTPAASSTPAASNNDNASNNNNQETNEDKDKDKGKGKK